MSASLVELDTGAVRTLAAVERDLIFLAVAQSHENMSEAARRLGIGRSTLYRKLEQYQHSLTPTQPPEGQPDAHPHREQGQDAGGDDGR